jgi:signal transduction histidine kinase
MFLNVIGQINQFGWPEALTFILLYSAALIFVAAFSARTIQAEEARARAESLLVELQQANQRLQELAGQAEELAIAKERNRLARDLHDSVAQTLYGLTLQSEAASRQLAAGKIDRVAEYLQEIRQSTLQTLGETRLLIFELRPPILEEIGLNAAIRARLEAVEARSGLKVEADLQDIGRLPSLTEVGLYRIAQEALNNILKHSQAKSVQVALYRRADFVTLEISDDGVGIADLPAEVNRFPRGGLGLKGMAERAEQIGGKLSLSGSPGQGVTIKIEVPR